MKRIFFYTSIFLLIIYSCSSNKPKNIKNKDVPNWYLNPPKIEGKYVGVGDAKRPQISLSKTVATTRAMAEISRIVETQMTTMLKNYLQASGLGENATALEFTEDVTKSVSSSTLQGCQVERTEIIDGRVFVMAVYDFEEAKLKAKQAIEIESKRDEALFNEFKARQGFEALEQEINNLEKF